MRLKHIKLAGFKSFVDPTKVPFEQQMTAIVGPNGCGKSNIIDAVRWVLGESSAKNLRGDSMTDVIFNGAETRKPIGQASVELVFDNSEGRLKGNMADRSEVSIRRLVNRESQNSYFLNGSKCRRRDITDIFLGTGLGPRSYAIIEQGTISRLIESKPQELRVFIEEAAGISKYKERRRETENRIVHTRENLARLADIQSELTLRIDALHKQAEAAKRYRTLKADERKYKAELTVLRWQQYQQKHQGFIDKVTQIQADIERLVIEQSNNENALFSAKQKLNLGGEDVGELHSQKLSLTTNIARAEQNIEHIKQQQSTLNKEFTHAKEHLGQDNKTLSHYQKQLIEKQAELSECTPQLKKCQQQLELAQKALEQSNDKLYQWQQTREKFHQQNQRNAQQRAQLIANINTYEEDYTQKSEDKAALELSLNELASELTTLSSGTMQVQELEQLSAALEIKAQQVTTKQQNVKLLEQNLTAKRKSLAELQGQEQAQNINLAQLIERQKSRSDWQQKQLAWLESQNLNSEACLFEKLKVSDGWQLAVEQVLASWLQAQQITEFPSQTDLDTLLLVRANHGTANVITIDNRTLAAQVTGDNAFNGWLNTIFLAENHQQAQLLLAELAPEQSVICQDGTWLGHHFLKKGQINANVDPLTQRKEIEQLSLINHQFKADIEKTVNDITELEQQQKNVGALINTLTGEHKEQQQQLTHHQQALTLLKQQQQHLQQQTSRVENQLNQVNKLLPSIKEKQQTAEEQLAKLPTVNAQESTENESIEKAIADKEGTEQPQVTEQQLLQQSVKQEQQLVHQLNQQQQQLAVQIERINNQQTHLEQSQINLQDKVRLTEQQQQKREISIQENAKPLTENEQQLQAWLKEMLNVEGKLKFIQENLAEAHQESEQIEQKKVSANKRITALKETLAKQHLDAESYKIRAQNMLEQLQELQVSHQQIIKTMPTEAKEAIWQAQLIRIAKDISRLGAINLAAIGEYEQQLSRKNYLEQQNDDLVTAITTLEAAIHKIDRESRQKFRVTFDQVNQDLKKLFPKVFGGGSAYLDLTGEDLLDTGVTIMARPPGKKNSTIHLLSGGEKALTALSLVFAIFRLNPAPFCMLDEVDAPLDDANVERFCNLVREMSQTVQFIYISHNKIAMEMASQLTGVTMFEAGVSRMVAVDIDEAIAMADKT